MKTFELIKKHKIESNLEDIIATNAFNKVKLIVQTKNKYEEVDCSNVIGKTHENDDNAVIPNTKVTTVQYDNFHVYQFSNQNELRIISYNEDLSCVNDTIII